MSSGDGGPGRQLESSSVAVPMKGAEMENNTAVNGNIGPDQIIADANNLISRIERIKKIDPCEIASLQVFAINYISKICAVVSCGITETVLKAYVHLATQLWIDRERYLNTRDFRTQRIGGHNSAYHIHVLRSIIKIAKKLKKLAEKS